MNEILHITRVSINLPTCMYALHTCFKITSILCNTFYYTIILIFFKIARLNNDNFIYSMLFFVSRFFLWEQMSCLNINCRHHASTNLQYCTTARSRQCGTGLFCYWLYTLQYSRPTPLPFSSMTEKNRKDENVAILVVLWMW